MLKKAWYCGALVCLLVVPVMARAQQQQPPTVVLRMQSFETVIKNVKVVAKAVDKAELGNQLEQLIKAQTGPNGLEGVDTTRPIGMYGRVSKDATEFSAVIMIPISNEKAFLNLLKNVNYPAQKNNDGVYIVQQFDVPFDIGFRFANKYAYVTGLTFQAIDAKNLLTPAQIFPKKLSGVLSATVQVDQVPDTFRKIAISQIEENAARVKREGHGDTAKQRAFLAKAVDTASNHAIDFLDGATNIDLQINFDGKAKAFTADVTINAKKNSRIKAQIQALSKTTQLLSKDIVNKADMASNMFLAMPKALRADFYAVIDELVRTKINEEPNAAARALLNKLADSLSPTVKAGVFNSSSAAVLHKDKSMTAVGAVRLTRGMQIEKSLRDIHRVIPPNDRKNITLDIAKVGNVSVHSINIKDIVQKEQERRLYGETMYVAIRDDALFFAVGKNAQSVLTKAIKSTANSSPVFFLKANADNFLEVFAENDTQRKIARQVFQGGEKGRIVATVEADERLHIHISVDLSLLKLAAALEAAKNEVRLDQSQVNVGR